MNSTLNILLIVLGVSIIQAAESSEVKDVKSLIGKLSRENHLSHAPCNCVPKTLSKPKLTSRETEMSEEERKQRLNEAIERLKQFLALFGHIDSFLTQKTNGLIRFMGKTIESDLKEDDYESQRQLYRRNMRKYWPYAYSPQPPVIPATLSS